MDIFLVDQDDPAAKTLMKKLAERSKPGAIIPLTSEEMALYNDSESFKHVLIGSSFGNPSITKLEPNSNYVFVCDTNVNIDDVVQLRERAFELDGIKIGIVRARS
jgi:hypothetical protein